MVYVLLGNGFEEIEAITPVDVLRRCGVEVQTAGIGGQVVEGGHGIPITADCTVDEIDQDALEMIVIPGGLGGVNSISASEPAMTAIRRAWDAGKYVAAICAGPTVLKKLGISDGRQVTSYPGLRDELDGALYRSEAKVVVDGKLITSQGPGTSAIFALELARRLCGEEIARQTAEGMLLA